MEHDQAALWLGRIEEAAREAGGIMLRARDIRSRVADKAGHANFVTAYDKQVQDMLFDRLRKVVPDAAFIGEENGADRVGDDSRSGYAFCVDPIDGTSNFLTGYRPSMTSIALMKDGVYLANFARGGIVDGDAVCNALESGKIAGYATDFPPPA